MTENEKNILLSLLNKVIDEVKTRPSLADSLVAAHNTISNIMSEEELDHRAFNYEPEYAQ